MLFIAGQFTCWFPELSRGARNVKERQQTFSAPVMALLQCIMMDAQKVHIAVDKSIKQECKLVVSRQLTVTNCMLKVYSILVI